jgi:hypothetical protein
VLKSRDGLGMLGKLPSKLNKPRGHGWSLVQGHGGKFGTRRSRRLGRGSREHPDHGPSAELSRGNRTCFGLVVGRVVSKGSNPIGTDSQGWVTWRSPLPGPTWAEQGQRATAGHRARLLSLVLFPVKQTLTRHGGGKNVCSAVGRANHTWARPDCHATWNDWTGRTHKRAFPEASAVARDDGGLYRVRTTRRPESHGRWRRPRIVRRLR